MTFANILSRFGFAENGSLSLKPANHYRFSYRSIPLTSAKTHKARSLRHGLTRFTHGDRTLRIEACLHVVLQNEALETAPYPLPSGACTERCPPVAGAPRGTPPGCARRRRGGPAALARARRRRTRCARRAARTARCARGTARAPGCARARACARADAYACVRERERWGCNPPSAGTQTRRTSLVREARG